MQKDIMDWLKTQANVMPATSQNDFYIKYTQAFPQAPLSHTQFGRFLSSQGIVRSSTRYGTKVVKAYSAIHNPEFSYTPTALNAPCGHCNGKGFIKIVH